MAHNQIVHYLARKFSLQVQTIHPIKSGVYHLVSASGEHFCLKKMGYPIMRIQWMDSILLDLRSKGFDAIAWRNPKSQAGRLLAARPHIKASPYILTP